MSNIYRFVSIDEEKEKRIIDNNELVLEKLEKIRREMEKQSNIDEDGFSLGLDAEKVSTLLEDESEEEQVVPVQQTAEEMLEQAKQEADELIQNANQEAEQIKAGAQREREQVLEAAEKEGFEKGYEEARLQCQQEFAKKEADLNHRKEELERELEEEKQKLEPMLVDTILDVFSSVTHVLAEDKKDLILAIVNSAFEDIESSKHYLIKACHEDAVFLRENKHRIQTAVPEAEIDIVEDALMQKGDCIIDTELGVFDCSLDLQLEQLTEDIKILACAGHK